MPDAFSLQMSSVRRKVYEPIGIEALSCVFYVKREREGKSGKGRGGRCGKREGVKVKLWNCAAEDWNRCG
jgi:hypothetical protein